jgi:hypothetical protein
MEVIPDIKYNKMAWFDYFDEDSSGELSQAEVVRGLIKSFRCGQDLRQVLLLLLLPPIRASTCCKKLTFNPKQKNNNTNYIIQMHLFSFSNL